MLFSILFVVICYTQMATMNSALAEAPERQVDGSTMQSSKNLPQLFPTWHITDKNENDSHFFLTLEQIKLPTICDYKGAYI